MELTFGLNFNKEIFDIQMSMGWKASKRKGRANNKIKLKEETV